MKQQILLPGVSLPRHDPLPEQELPPTFTELPGGEYPAFVDGQSDADTWPSVQSMMSSLIVFEPHHPTPRPLDVIGVALGQPLSPAQEQRIANADVVAAEFPLLQRLFPYWQEPAADAPRPDKNRHSGRRKKRRAPSTTAGCEFLCLSPPQTDASLCRLTALHRASKNMVVLCQGDPLFMSTGMLLRGRFEAQHLRFTPAVSAVQEVASRLALPWHNWYCLSLRGAPSWHSLHTAIYTGRPLCLFTDADMEPDAIARHLLDRGVEWFHAHILERVGTEDERLRSCSLYEAAALTDCTAPAVVVLLPEGTPRRPYIGLSDTPAVSTADTPPPVLPVLAAETSAAAPVLTPAVRAQILSLLHLLPHHVMWHIGAGSGELAAEACTLTPQGTVVAVEHSPGRALGLRELRRRWGAVHMDVCSDAAPDCFPRLPRPDRICVSGGLTGDTADVLLTEALRLLRPSGRMVVVCRHPQALATVADTLRDSPCAVHLLQTASSALTPLNAPLPPLQPVYLALCTRLDGTPAP